MANRTVKDAVTVKGTNPQYLVEKIIRTRIYDSRYWKEECFALSAELLVDKAMQLKYVGGVFGDNVKVTPFLCLTLKMLQIQPEKDIVIEFIKNEDYKYVRVLGAYYMRLTGTSLDCYNYIEPLLNDYRKVRLRNRQGGYELSHVDQFVDALLRDERMCDVILPRIQRRQVLEESGELEPRVSALDDDLDDLPIDNDHIDDDDDDDDDDDRADSLEDLQMTRSTTAAAAAAAANGGGAHSNSYHGDTHWRHRDHRGHRDTRDYRDSRGYREDRDRYRYREEERGGGGGGGGRRSAERYHHRERRSDGRRSRERERVRAHGRSGRQREEDEQPGRQRQSRHERHHRHKERRKRHRSASGDDHQRRQIDEANALRAKLGLAPLRP